VSRQGNLLIRPKESNALTGFGERVKGITCLSRCVGAQGERFFPRSVGAQERNL